MRFSEMGAWLYKWLPIFFGCHQRPERSFHFRGKPFPICARCTGELVGMIAGVALYAVWHPGLAPVILLMAPMVLDGGIQALTPYESGNVRRLVTGAIFGYGLVTAGLLLSVWSFQQGMALGLRLRYGG